MNFETLNVEGASGGPVGNSDERWPAPVILKGEILVPCRSPQQHLTASCSEQAPSPELPLLGHNKKGARVKNEAAWRLFQFSGKIVSKLSKLLYKYERGKVLSFPLPGAIGKHLAARPTTGNSLSWLCLSDSTAGGKLS